MTERLVVSRSNPRYFEPASSAGSGPAVYLSGSHVNNNFHDGAGPGLDCADVPEVFDFGAYLDFLEEHGHNFIRLWRWEHIRSQIPFGEVHLCMSPQPWARTGPGDAVDGKPRFDLSRLDQAYFDRLRSRVEAAGARGIYVSVMLFDGFALHLTRTPDNVRGHPFHAGNNINGVGIGSIRDYQVLPLDPRVQALQEAYLRKVVDTVGDLPNVLYEVANESSGSDTADAVTLPDGSTLDTRIGDSTEWQYWVIEVVRRYEQESGHGAHPIGMSMQYPVPDESMVNEVLFDSPADWISPGFDEPVATEEFADTAASGRWLIDPPANDGRKVILSDTDHYSPMQSDALWAWRSFLRGHNPVLYDLGIFAGPRPSEQSEAAVPYESLEPARLAMGDTVALARRVTLIEMEPRGELASTGYMLASRTGVEFIVLQPEARQELTVRLPSGRYQLEWYLVTHRQTVPAGTITVDSVGSVAFTPPGSEPCVLYLKAVSG